MRSSAFPTTSRDSNREKVPAHQAACYLAGDAGDGVPRDGACKSDVNT